MAKLPDDALVKAYVERAAARAARRERREEPERHPLGSQVGRAREARLHRRVAQRRGRRRPRARRRDRSGAEAILGGERLQLEAARRTRPATRSPSSTFRGGSGARDARCRASALAARARCSAMLGSSELASLLENEVALVRPARASGSPRSRSSSTRRTTAESLKTLDKLAAERRRDDGAGQVDGRTASEKTLTIDGVAIHYGIATARSSSPTALKRRSAPTAERRQARRQRRLQGGARPRPACPTETPASSTSTSKDALPLTLGHRRPRGLAASPVVTREPAAAALARSPGRTGQGDTRTFDLFLEIK